MSTWKITLNSPWFSHVQNRDKIYEGHCYWKSAPASLYKVGDTLEISHHTDATQDSFQVKITDIQIFDSFEHALNAILLSEVLPGINSIEEGINIYYKYVSLPTQLANKVCMIKIQKIK